MKKIKVSICTGTTCYVMGASDLLLLEEVLPEHLKGKVEIEGVTCLEKCKSTGIGKNKAPFVIFCTFAYFVSILQRACGRIITLILPLQFIVAFESFTASTVIAASSDTLIPHEQIVCMR